MSRRKTSIACLLGLVACQDALPVTSVASAVLYPQVKPKPHVISITYIAEGAPGPLETRIANPAEGALRDLTGVAQVSTFIRTGRVEIDVELSAYTEPQAVRAAIQARLSALDLGVMIIR